MDLIDFDAIIEAHSMWRIGSGDTGFVGFYYNYGEINIINLNKDLETLGYTVGSVEGNSNGQVEITIIENQLKIK